MTLQEQILALLAEAAPLRLLPDAEAEAKGLPGIVDRINALQAQVARQPLETVATPQEGADAEDEPKRKPGRPPKAK